MRSPLGIALAAAAALGTHDVHADSPCAAALAPSSVSLRDTGLDRNRVACGVNGFGIGTRALATIDTPNFYGTLSASLLLDYRYLHGSGFEFSVGARLVDYRFAQSAVFTDGEAAVGPVSVGALRPRKTSWWGVDAVVGHEFRLEVPVTDSSKRSVAVAGSPAVLATLMPSENVHMHGRLAALLWSILPESGADSRAALLASSDVAYAPLSVFSLTAGVESQIGWYGVGLDHLQVRGGFRVRTHADSAIEISGATTLAGHERNDLVLWIGYASFHNTKPKPRRSRLQEWAQ